MRPSTWWGRLQSGGIAACILFSCLVAGCTTARSDLGTSDSSCYLALPTATAAVMARGHLLGVHPDTLTELRRQAPGLFDDVVTKDSTSQRVCVVAFGGQFTAANVSDPLGLPSGRLAVVVSTTPGNRLLGVVIYARPPFHFGHSQLG